MPSTATRTASKAHVTVPEQPLTLIRNARKTARALGGTLAASKETMMDAGALTKARDGKYLLAVDPRDLPPLPGWYLVERKNRSFKPVLPERAYELIRRGGEPDALYVAESVADAIREGRPVALDCRAAGSIDVSDWPPYAEARVAVSKEANPPGKAAVRALRK